MKYTTPFAFRSGYWQIVPASRENSCYDAKFNVYSRHSQIHARQNLDSFILVRHDLGQSSGSTDGSCADVLHDAVAGPIDDDRHRDRGILLR